MDKALKRKWLKALRSGKIKQGRGALLDENGSMCCVGVLGRVCGIPDEKLFEKRTQLLGEGLEAIGVLGDEAWTLAAMNDGCKHNEKVYKPHSFKQIANWIEKNL